jgi:uncharacterized protein YacL (UPF0231 family)
MKRILIPRVTRHCKICKSEFVAKENSTQQYCSKKCCQSDPETKERIRNTLRQVWDTKYGGKHPMSMESTQKKHKDSLKEKYGVEHALQSKNLIDKVKKTKLDRYGSGTFNNINKAKHTKFEKYGDANYNGNHKRTDTKYETITDTWKHLKPLFTIDEFTGVSFNQRYKFQCVECDYKFDAGLNSGYIPRCKACAMKKVNAQSNGEKQIIEYIKNLCDTSIKERDRNILAGKELDIYLPEKNIAIEFNGIYWHSEHRIQNKYYHLKKLTQCAVRGVQLLHIFDYQWYQKQDIIKSMIASKLGITSKIYARKCTIKKVNSKDKGIFLNSTHIQGSCNSPINLGLYYNDELVAIATFGKSRYDKKYEYELLRYSSKLNTTIVGGFSKLLNHFINEYSPKNILTYCDRSTSTGNMYFKTGFTLLGNTNPNYYYFKDSNVYSREQFQKHTLKSKLPIFNEQLTEYANMQLNGYDRFWDCGNWKFVYTVLE